MEGPLLVPPDRGTIIGRALWKPRYVVLGYPASVPQTLPQTQPPPLLPRTFSHGRLQAARSAIRNASTQLDSKDSIPKQTDQLYLSVYKQKDDEEAIWQYPVTAIKSCEIQSLQHRKPGPALPTLVVTLHPDVASEKQRKRRSSRASTLSSTSSSTDSLFFRSVPEDQYNIFDWQMGLQSRMRPKTAESFDLPTSPTSPTFSSFINPFAPKGKKSDWDRRLKSSAEMEERPTLRHHGSSQTYAGTQGKSQANERPLTSTLISPSPSLRSRRSDLSSQASSFNHMGGKNSITLPIQTHGPNELPSPAPTSAGYGDEPFISGWTSAQGRSSALSSHTRGSNSVVSMGSTPPQANFPLGPRETILDRAFMMRYIPGSERINPGDEGAGTHLSSIARFEALMREAEEKKRLRTQKAASIRSHSGPTRKSGDERKDSGNDLESEGENNEQDGADAEEGNNEDGSDGESYIRQGAREHSSRIRYDDEDDDLALSVHEIPTSAQRALEYISGRSTSSTSSLRPTSRPSSKSQAAPLPLLSERPMLHMTRKSHDRPRSQVSAPTSNPTNQEPDSHRPPPPVSFQPPPQQQKEDESSTQRQQQTHAQRPPLDRRSSGKRISFTEFAKRLSSSSSLLLVQTNASSSTNASIRNSRGSSTSDANGIDDDTLTMGSLQRGLSQSRLSGMGAGYLHHPSSHSSRGRDNGATTVPSASSSSAAAAGSGGGSGERDAHHHWRAGAVGGGLGGEGGFL